MQVVTETMSDTEVEASYACSCGCKPRVGYQRDAEDQKHVCCCGNELVVGRDVLSGFDLPDGVNAEVESFESPWGETLQFAWVLGSDLPQGHSPRGHTHPH